MGIHTRKAASKKTITCSSQSSGFSTTGGRVRSQQTLSATGLRHKLTLQKAASRRKLQGVFHNLYNNSLLIEVSFI